MRLFRHNNMAPSCLHVMCLLFVLAVGVAAYLSNSFVATTHELRGASARDEAEVNQDEYSCGDNLCKCWDIYGLADCNSRHLKYVPKLPANVVELWFDENDLGSQTMAKNYFANISYASKLAIINNQLECIPREVLGVISNLTSLSINYNPFNVSCFKELFLIPSLQHLFAWSCQFSHFPHEIFHGINSNVTELNLENNHFHSLNLSLFYPLKQLRILDLKSCRIRDITLNTTLWLHELQLSENKLEVFPKTCGGRNGPFLPELELLDLSRNRIWDLPIMICLPKLKRLVLCQNIIQSLSFSFRTRNLPSLEYLDLKSQSPDFRYGNTQINNSKLKELNLKDNHLNFNPGKDVDVRSFANCQQLSVLFLDGNNFEGVDKEEFQQLFGHLPVKKLSMKRTNVDEVYSGTISKFSSLVELDLSSNKITSIPNAAFDSNRNLTRLDLSNNRISVVFKDTFGKVTRGRLIQLSLANNPFVCSCHLVWFRNWLVSDTSLFRNSPLYYLPRDDVPQYTCSNIPNVMVENFKVVEQSCLFSKETNIQIIVILSLIITLLTGFSLLFRYRWHIRLILYEGFRDRDDARRRRLQENNFDYDVFVSYASEDLPWVREHLMPELEDRLRLRLCVHERDFIPGKNIVDNIADCVERSKKILMVFSRDFVKSQWCQFELTYCLSHAMDHDDVLIIVCVDDVASREMTTAMMAVLKTTTCIQWELHIDAIDAFWGRVYMSLNEIMQPRRV